MFVKAFLSNYCSLIISREVFLIVSAAHQNDGF